MKYLGNQEFAEFECSHCLKNEAEREKIENDLITIYNSKTWKVYLFYRKVKNLILSIVAEISKRIVNIFLLLKYRFQNRVFYEPDFKYTTRSPVHYLLPSASYEPKISVIIPHFNQNNYLNHALKSLKLQSYQDFETIIIDDASSKKSAHRVETLVKKYKCKLIINNKRKGPGHCRNIGINQARGKYILCLDSDDVLPNYSLLEMVVTLENNPCYGFVYGNYQYFDYKNYLEKRQKYNFYNLLKENYIIVTSLFQKILWQECGGFDEDMDGYEDWDFWINLGKNGWYGFYLDRVLLNVRIKHKSRNLQAIKRNKVLIEYLKEKHKDLYSKNNISKIKKIWK